MKKIEEKTWKYILKTEKVLKDLRVLEDSISIDKRLVEEIVDKARRYFEDAKYYFRRKEYEVSLTSIAYCEGLLDALRILNLVDFEW